MEELLSAIVAAIMLGSMFVCITVIVYHKISCTHRLRVCKVKAQIPKIILVNDIEVEKAINAVLPEIESDDVCFAAYKLKEMVSKIGAGR